MIGQQRFINAGTFLKEQYDILRTIGKDRYAGGLFIYVAPKMIFDIYYKNEIAEAAAENPPRVLTRPDPIIKPNEPDWTDKAEVAKFMFMQGKWDKYCAHMEDYRHKLIAQLDPDDKMGIESQADGKPFSLDAYTAMEILEWIEKTLNKSSDKKRVHLRSELKREISDGEQIQAYVAFQKRIFDAIADAQKGVEYNEHDKYHALLSGIAQKHQIAAAALRYRQDLARRQAADSSSELQESFDELAHYLIAQADTFDRTTAKAAGFAAAAESVTLSVDDRISKMEKLLADGFAAAATVAAAAADGGIKANNKKSPACFDFLTGTCKKLRCRFTHIKGKIDKYCWVCGAFDVGAVGAHNGSTCSQMMGSSYDFGIGLKQKASTSRRLAGHTQGDEMGSAKFTQK